jgi:hypothetical protein
LTAIIFFLKTPNVVRVPPSSKSLSPSVQQERGTKKQKPSPKSDTQEAATAAF